MLYIFLIVSLLLIIIYLIVNNFQKNNFQKNNFQNNNFQKNNFQNNNFQNNDYRLGDFILIPVPHKKQEHLRTIREKYSNSIAGLYYKKTNKSGDIDTLIDVLTENNMLKKNNNITMHIRLGDVLCENRRYDKKPSPLDKIITFIKTKFKNEQIHIYTFLHFGGGGHDCREKSLKYINELKKLRNVSLHTAGNPDKDFLEMINSKIHIAGTGGYSNLINMVRKKLNLETLYIS